MPRARPAVPTGRILGFGEFIVESAGQDQAMRNVKFLPYPEQLYLEVCGLHCSLDRFRPLPAALHRRPGGNFCRGGRCSATIFRVPLMVCFTW